MGIFFDAPVPVDAITTFTRNVPLPTSLALSQLFPARTFPSNVVDLAEITATNRTARYRTWDGALHVSKRDTGKTSRVPLLPLSSSLNMGEYERLQLEFARVGGTATQVLADAVYNDAAKLTNEIYYRLEQAWGDVLTDGKLTLSEGGYVAAETDYLIPGSQIVAPATLWSDTSTSTPLTNMVAWLDVWVAANGAPPGRTVTSLRVLRLLQKNTEIINAVHGAAAGRTRVTTTELNDLLASEGLPPIETTYDANVDVDGVTTRTVADDRFIWTPSDVSELGFTAWGTTATGLELARSNSVDMTFGDAAGIVGVVIKEGPPFREYTFVDAVAMPVLADSRKILVADVA